MIKGKVWKFGNNVDTDVIYPGSFLTITTDTAEMAKHCFERVHPDFVKKAKSGDIIIAGKFFGCGSSREQAVTCLKAFGIQAIIAESFARIYYRNAINLGMPILIAKGVFSKINEGDVVEINLEKGIIKNETTGEQIEAQKLPEFIMKILKDGGLIPHLKKKLQKE